MNSRSPLAQSPHVKTPPSELQSPARAARMIHASLILRRQVPTRSRSTSPDLFWTTASPKALVMWVPLEAAGLLALVQYFVSVNPIALAAAAVPLTLLAVLNPWLLERA